MKNQDLVNGITQQNQILLRLNYQRMHRQQEPLPALADIEFRSFSQNGEDGILLFIFSLIGTTNKQSVEVCAGNGIECNSANLIVNHAWKALLFDGDDELVQKGVRFYRSHPNTAILPPVFKQAWITKDNVNSLIKNNGFSGEVDLLTIDVDGNDWWLWHELEVINPRLIAVEFNCVPELEHALVMPYKADFYKGQPGTVPFAYGATLPAFVSLAKTRDYRLIGVDRHGINAFFLRNDIGQDVFAEAQPEDFLTNNPFVQARRDRYQKGHMKQKWLNVDDALGG